MQLFDKKYHYHAVGHHKFGKSKRNIIIGPISGDSSQDALERARKRYGDYVVKRVKRDY